MTGYASASLGSFGVSAPRNRRAEYVRVVAVVIAPLEFGDVERQIFTTDFVKAAHDAALHKRPGNHRLFECEQRRPALCRTVPCFFSLQYPGYSSVAIKL